MLLSEGSALAFFLLLAATPVLAIFLIRAIISRADAVSPANTKSKIYSTIAIVIIVSAALVAVAVPYLPEILKGL